jgi:transposase
MSNKPIKMSKVRNLLRLYTEGVSKQSIAERTGLPRNTVKKYINLFEASNRSLEELGVMSDGELELMFLEMVPRSYIEDDPKYKAALEYFPDMEKAYKRKDVTKEQLWQRYRAKNPDGYGLSQFKKYFLMWQRARNPVAHIEHKAGAKMYVDYAGDKLQIMDPQTGEIIKLEVFVAILGGSQLTFVEASMSQKTEDFISSCENALSYFGGSPLAIVTDNLKAAVIKGSRYEPVINDAFRDFASHYTMAVLPAAPYKPTHKALVEGAVKIIYKSIYGEVRSGFYTSVATINNAILVALDAHNERLMSGRPYSRRQMFNDEEASALQALPLHRYELKRRKTVTVMKNNFVNLGEDKHYYSVPYHFIGKKVTLLYSQSEVEVFYRHERIAVHDRDRKAFKHTVVEDHLASKHRFLTDWNPEKFIQRASEVGEACKAYIEGLLAVRQHPEQAYRSCQGVLSFGPRAGYQRLNNACKRALLFGDFSYHIIRVILEKGLDREDLSGVDDPSPDSPDLPDHDNKRGKDYYK